MTKPQLDVLIVPGSVREKERYFRAMAAGYCLKNNIAKNIVFSGGKTKNVIESESMKQIFLKRFKSNKKILIDNKSTDTSSNIQYSLELIDKNGWSYIGLLTNQYHLKRCIGLSKAYGIKATGISVENMLNNYDKVKHRELTTYMLSDEMKSILKLEKLLNKYMIIDNKGLLPKISSKLYYKLIN